MMRSAVLSGSLALLSMITLTAVSQPSHSHLAQGALKRQLGGHQK